MTCDGSGELRFGWWCPGCAACDPAPRHYPPTKPLTADQRTEHARRVRETDPWRQPAA